MISNELESALVERDDHLDGAQLVTLGIGQAVRVKTKDGRLVIEGSIEELVPETGVVRVRNTVSGTDVHIPVNIDQYDIWVQDETVGSSRRGGIKPLSVFTQASDSKVFAGGRS